MASSCCPAKRLCLRSEKVGVINKKYYLNAIREDPNDILSYFELERIYSESGQLDAAKKILITLVKQKPDAVAYNNLAIILSKLGKIKQSLRMCKKAIALEPNYKSPYIQAGSNYLSLHHYAKAIVFFKKALRANSANLIPIQKELVFVNMGFAYDKMGITKKALDAYRSALKINPRYSLAHTNISAIYLDLRKFSSAIKHARLSLRANRNDTRARHNLALAYLYSGKRSYFFRLYRVLQRVDHEMAKKCLKKLTVFESKK